MFESKINKGRANGYAPLDSGSKVPLSYLPPIQSPIDTGSFATTSSLQTFSESIDGRVTDLESWSSSLDSTFATDLQVSIVSSSVAATIAVVSSAVGLVTTSSFNTYTASQSTASLATTGSNEFIGNQTISGSLTTTEFIQTSVIQATGSLYLQPDSTDNRHFEIYNTSPTDVHIKSNGGLSFFGDDTNYLKIDDSAGDVTIAAFSDIILTADDGGVYIGSYGSGNGVVTNGYLDTIIGDTNIINGSTGNSITDAIGRIPIVNSGSLVTTSSFNEFTSSLDGVVSGSSQLTSSYDTRYTLSGSVQPLPNGLISGSSQLTASYDTRYTLSGSVQPLPNGLISGSSQLTASYDTRYLLSGSVQPLPNGLISGSSQLTASYDTRYLLSGSSTSRVFASDTAPSSPTQGDLWWKSNDGNLYVYYDSYWIIATDTISALPNGLVSGSSQLPTLATTGSNTFTGTNIFNGQVTLGGVGGDEGGELRLVTAETNTTLTGSYVTTDIFQNRLRFYEGGGTFRGVYVDLTKAPAGNAGELMWKVSGFVNAGTFLTLDNLKVSVTTSGNRGLSIGAVSTNFTANVSGWLAWAGGGGGTSAVNVAYTTTASASAFGWGFTTEGDGSYYTILDKTNNRVYRVTLMIGAGYNNNFISIERLH